VHRFRVRPCPQWALVASLLAATAVTAARAEDPVNGCTLRQAVDWTEVGPDPRHIDFACCAYTPPCVRIRPNRTVRWLGDFTMHPLRPGVFVGGTPQPQPGNPIPSVDAGTSSGQITFPQPGAWGFYCNFHGASSGMYGTVYVALFADGFESHDLSAWSVAVPAPNPLLGPPG
jgi:plastocyanin